MQPTVSMNFGHQVKERLLARRHALLDRYLDELDRATDEVAAADVERVGRAADQYDAHLLRLLGEADAHALREVSGAIERFDSGSYGKCVRCCHDIGARRLEALPAIPLCFSCASRANT